MRSDYSELKRDLMRCYQALVGHGLEDDLY